MGFKERSTEKKLHALCIPLPFQSHVTVMMSFAKLLYYKGFQITFVNTQFNHARLLKTQGAESMNALPDFRFESFPDGLPLSDPNASQHLPTVAKAVQNQFLAPFLHLITNKLKNFKTPLTCILADVFMAFAYQAGEDLGIPVIGLSAVSASTLLGTHQLQLKDPMVNADDDTFPQSVPGMRNLPQKDILRFEDVGVFNFFVEATKLASQRKSPLIINTVEVLETEELKKLASKFCHTEAVGPIHLLLKQIPRESPINSIRSNLWEEESECIRWLDSRDPCSVVYVSFGSIAAMTMDQIIEFALGLADCNRNFLWAIRPDIVESAVLPLEFRERTKERGFITSWCHQEYVLNHASVGAFVTHCGWNSTLESVSSGVPMICVPFFGDQPANCRYICAVWKVGIEMDGDLRREDVIRAVARVMEGEEGIKMKEKAVRLKGATCEAANANDGSSSMNLNKLLNRLVFDRFESNQTTKNGSI